MATEKRLIDASPDDCIKKVKRKTNFAKIIVSGTAEKPYYEIMWHNYMDGQRHIGYGSYNLSFVFQWLAECFEVEAAPTMDAVEVVHGEWLEEHGFDVHNNEYWVHCCSVCEEQALVDVLWREEQLTDYCPYCGAKMDGGKSEQT